MRHRQLVQPEDDDDVQVADAPGADGRHGSSRLGEVQGHRQEDECRLPAGGATEPRSMPQEIAEGRQRTEGDQEKEKARQSRTSSCQEAETQETEEARQEVPVLLCHRPLASRCAQDGRCGLRSGERVERATRDGSGVAEEVKGGEAADGLLVQGGRRRLAQRVLRLAGLLEADEVRRAVDGHGRTARGFIDDRFASSDLSRSRRRQTISVVLVQTATALSAEAATSVQSVRGSGGRHRQGLPAEMEPRRGIEGSEPSCGSRGVLFAGDAQEEAWSEFRSAGRDEGG